MKSVDPSSLLSEALITVGSKLVDNSFFRFLLHVGEPAANGLRPSGAAGSLSGLSNVDAFLSRCKTFRGVR
jgi:hypothetical protein